MTTLQTPPMTSIVTPVRNGAATCSTSPQSCHMTTARKRSREHTFSEPDAGVKMPKPAVKLAVPRKPSHMSKPVLGASLTSAADASQASDASDMSDLSNLSAQDVRLPDGPCDEYVSGAAVSRQSVGKSSVSSSALKKVNDEWQEFMRQGRGHGQKSRRLIRWRDDVTLSRDTYASLMQMKDFYEEDQNIIKQLRQDVLDQMREIARLKLQLNDQLANEQADEKEQEAVHGKTVPNEQSYHSNTTVTQF